MIPLQLTLKNFLSYCEANLDFVGLHTACICGSNGAGKSSLLEGITWAIWGKCRAASEDDAILNGAIDVRVDFTFQIHGETCRIIRNRQRGGSGSLEFQIQGNDGKFRTLTQKGIKATQELINNYLKIDYDTFINSAYLRQGKADEFMLKKPTDRKQILADLLKLDRYEELADRAKESVKKIKVQTEVLEQNLAEYQTQLGQVDRLQEERGEVKETIANLQEFQTADESELEVYKTTARQRDTWQQQLVWEQKRDRELAQDSDRVQQDIAQAIAEQNRLEKLIIAADDITNSYHQYLALEEKSTVLEQKFQAYQEAQTQQQQLQQQLEQNKQQLQLELGKVQAELAVGKQQEEEIVSILNTADEVAKGLAELQQAKAKLNTLDELQQQVSPLEQRRISLQAEIDRVSAKLQARLEELNTRILQEQQELNQQSDILKNIASLDKEITEVGNKKVYQERVKEKGLDKGAQIQIAQEHQRNCTKQLQALDRKLELLKTPDAACPLCDRPLDEEHWQHVLDDANNERENLERQLSIAQQEEIVYTKERELLRAEYKQLSQELGEYDSLRDRRSQLQAQLDRLADVKLNLERLIADKKDIEATLERRSYAQELQLELQELLDNLARIDYDEKTHALARGEVNRLQRAEIKQSQLKDAQNRQQLLLDRRTKLEEKITALELEIVELSTNSQLWQQLQDIDHLITSINYDRAKHQQVMAKLRETQAIQIQYHDLQQAQQSYPQLQQRLQELQDSYQEKQRDRELTKLEIERISVEIAKIPDSTATIQSIEAKIAQRRQELDNCFAILGGLERQLSQLDNIRSQLATKQQQLQEYKQQQRIYEELSKAFGKNGIQALIIENILPQLEVETNQILSRLSNNQFHVQFITQKATKSSTKSKKANIKNAKFIDTLDIAIGDATGTRAYETYSGGEAFRINFSIRLALAKLLSQRAGTPLQMLIVDEGFGTQDPEGCDRLIAAINAIASDFACILTVTHMPQFREAFQTRIEVRKTTDGSKIRVIT